MRFLFFIILSILIFNQSSAQNIAERVKFSEYLVNQGLYEEAVYESNQILSLKLTKPRADSIFYFKGWANYNLKQLQESAISLKQVSEESKFYPKSQLFSAYNFIHIGKYDEAASILNSFHKSDETQEIFSLFLHSGIKLLNRDVEAFRQTAKKLPNNYFGFAKEMKKLNSIASSLEQNDPKSPVLAGIMSGIIPGSGQIYAGKTGQGIAAMLMTSGLALVALENHNKRGPEKFETIFFGSVFTVFYIGNIYGATFSAKLANDENNELTNRQILFNLHIPLRNIFD